MYDAGVAINGLSCFLSADLARDLANDIMTLVRLAFLIFGEMFFSMHIDPSIPCTVLAKIRNIHNALSY